MSSQLSKKRKLVSGTNDFDKEGIEEQYLQQSLFCAFTHLHNMEMELHGHVKALDVIEKILLQQASIIATDQNPLPNPKGNEWESVTPVNPCNDLQADTLAKMSYDAIKHQRRIYLKRMYIGELKDFIRKSGLIPCDEQGLIAHPFNPESTPSLTVGASSSLGTGTEAGASTSTTGGPFIS